MSLLVAVMDTLLPPTSSEEAAEEEEQQQLSLHAYYHHNTSSPTSHQHVEQEHTCCVESDSAEDAGLSHDVIRDHWQLSVGLNDYGCLHYRRRCRIRAPCCNEIFDCRHCHNEAKNVNEEDPSRCHELPRHFVERVICSLCDQEQNVQQVCENCGVCMGEYFCSTCKFFDDEIKKRQYHCNSCGICRIGGRDNFFHCDRCGCCYSTTLQNGHPCIEKSMHHNCPVCFEYLFDSMKDITVLPCGHTMHLECMRDMHSHAQFCCPICSKSICDMTSIWRHLDQEIAATPMPEPYQNKLVWILCNDCGSTNEVFYHVIAHKCAGCHSYNTRLIRGSPSPTFT
ncbi:unnamed protein product [Sphagnum troendelagicum]